MKNTEPTQEKQRMTQVSPLEQWMNGLVIIKIEGTYDKRATQ